MEREKKSPKVTYYAVINRKYLEMEIIIDYHHLYYLCLFNAKQNTHLLNTRKKTFTLRYV